MHNDTYVRPIPVNEITAPVSHSILNTSEDLFCKCMRYITRDMSNHIVIMKFWMHWFCNCTQWKCTNVHLALFSRFCVCMCGCVNVCAHACVFHI